MAGAIGAAGRPTDIGPASQTKNGQNKKQCEKAHKTGIPLNPTKNYDAQILIYRDAFLTEILGEQLCFLFWRNGGGCSKGACSTHAHSSQHDSRLRTHHSA